MFVFVFFVFAVCPGVSPAGAFFVFVFVFLVFAVCPSVSPAGAFFVLVFVFFVFAVCPGFLVGVLAVVWFGLTRKYTRAKHATRSLQNCHVMVCL